MFSSCYLFSTLKAYRSFLQRNQVEVTLEALWSLIRRYATINNSKQFQKCHLFCTSSKSILFSLVPLDRLCLFCLVFFFQAHAKVLVESTNYVLLFFFLFVFVFYTQFKSSSLLVSSRISLSDRERSRKQPSTTITKQYSNNTSWDARSRCVLESVLDVFMLAWVMSSIAAAERNQSAAVNPWDVASPSPCCLLQFHMYISPWRETGFQVAGSHCGLNSHNLSTRCPLTKWREYWNWSMIMKAWLILVRQAIN